MDKATVLDEGTRPGAERRSCRKSVLCRSLLEVECKGRVYMGEDGGVFSKELIVHKIVNYVTVQCGMRKITLALIHLPGVTS